MIEVFRKPFVTIEYDPLRRLLHLVWKGSVETPEFIETMDFVVDRSRDLEIRYVMIDTRQQGSVQKDATDYASSKLNELFHANIRKVFFILPISIYTQMSVEMFQDELKRSDQETKVLYFVDAKQAYECLSELV